MINFLAPLFDQDNFIELDTEEQLIYIESLCKCNALGVYKHEFENPFQEYGFSDRIVTDGKEVYFEEYFDLQPLDGVLDQAKEDWKDVKSDRIKKLLSERLGGERIPFDAVWTFYDKKQGKYEANKKWNRLTRKEQDKVMKHLKAWLPTIKDKTFQPMLSTYLNQKRYLDEIPSDIPEKAKASPVHTDDEVRSMF